MRALHRSMSDPVEFTPDAIDPFDSPFRPTNQLRRRQSTARETLLPGLADWTCPRWMRAASILTARSDCTKSVSIEAASQGDEGPSGQGGRTPRTFISPVSGSPAANTIWTAPQSVDRTSPAPTAQPCKTESSAEVSAPITLPLNISDNHKRQQAQCRRTEKPAPTPTGETRQDWSTAAGPAEPVSDRKNRSRKAGISLHQYRTLHCLIGRLCVGCAAESSSEAHLY